MFKSFVPTCFRVTDTSTWTLIVYLLAHKTTMAGTIEVLVAWRWCVAQIIHCIDTRDWIVFYVETETELVHHIVFWILSFTSVNLEWSNIAIIDTCDFFKICYLISWGISRSISPGIPESCFQIQGSIRGSQHSRREWHNILFRVDSSPWCEGWIANSSSKTWKRHFRKSIK